MTMRTCETTFKCPYTGEDMDDRCKCCCEFSHVSRLHHRPVCFEKKHAVPNHDGHQTTFDRKVRTHDQKTLESVFRFKHPDRVAHPDFETINLHDMAERIVLVLGTLTEREREVIVLRFGLEDGVSLTLDEVGKRFNVTRARIRQIETKALRKLRHPVRIRKLYGLIFTKHEFYGG